MLCEQRGSAMGKGYTHFSYCLATALFSVAGFSSGVSLDGCSADCDARRSRRTFACALLHLPAIGPLSSMSRCVRTCWGPKQTLLIAPHMSAFGGKADMTLCGNSLLRSLLGAKRT